jgi:hypothetical protein
MRKAFLRAVAPLAVLLLAAPIGRASVIYDAHDDNSVGELVPNGEDGTPNRPTGSRMGNTVVFGGTARGLDTVTLRYGTYHFDNQPSADQTITLSLYKPDGPADLTGPGLNGNQPGTLIGSRSITTSLFNAPDSGSDLLTFDFGGLVVPDSLVAIVSSTLISNANTQTGFIASSDFTPLVGSNPHGDRLWFGEGPGTFSSDDTWAQADSGGDPTTSNNMVIVFDAHDVPEPATASLLVACGTLLLRGRRRTRVDRGSRGVG